MDRPTTSPGRKVGLGRQTNIQPAAAKSIGVTRLGRLQVDVAGEGRRMPPAPVWKSRQTG